MTRPTEPATDRLRHPAGVVHAWLSVLVRPREFFQESIVPGEQARALLFAMGIVAVAETSRIALAGGSAPFSLGPPVLSAAVWLGLAVLLVTPAALHLVAALQTLLLIPIVSDRGGVSETVQVLGYSTAPCVLAGVPSPELRSLVVLWGYVVLAVGIGVVHGRRFEGAAALSAIPAAIVFGYGFRGFAAIETVLRQRYII